jgi:tRNA dimethylallyltransferase
MQVYREMDVGTAKPTAAERAEVPHHLLDIADPEVEFSVASFKRACLDALAQVEARGHRALLVGGTGLYLRAVVDDLEIPGRFPDARSSLDGEPNTLRLHRQLAAIDPVAAARMEPTNRRRVVRALEVSIGSGRPFSSYGPGLERYPSTGFRLVGLRVPRDELDDRIAQRFHRQMGAGWLDEVQGLHGRPAGLSRTARQALGYRELLAHVAGDCTLDDAVRQGIIRTRQFARRQDRWFRRDPRIDWIDGPGGQDGPAGHNALADFRALLGD